MRVRKPFSTSVEIQLRHYLECSQQICALSSRIVRLVLLEWFRSGSSTGKSFESRKLCQDICNLAIVLSSSARIPASFNPSRSMQTQLRGSERPITYFDDVLPHGSNDLRVATVAGIVYKGLTLIAAAPWWSGIRRRSQPLNGSTRSAPLA